MSHAARSHIVRALPGLWCSIAVLPCFSASRKAPVTRCGLLLRGTYAAYGAFSFGSRLSALRNTHNPSELHGKRMAERLPLQCSGTLPDGTLCHLPTVVPHRFFRRGFRLYRLRIAQPFSKCRHTMGRMGGATSRPGSWGGARRPTGSRHIPLAGKRLSGFLYLYSATNSTRGALAALAGLEPATTIDGVSPPCALPH